MNLTIDHRHIEAKEGMTILEAASVAGIRIPAMCLKEGLPHHPSCMMCLVKDLKSGKLLTSCAYPAEDGMEILTHSHEIREARKDALELLLSDHVGDCEAPCRRSCPAFMDIPNMNRLIAVGKFREALALVREEIALPLILGYICPAPCEKACHRSSIDGAVSICLLKRFVAGEEGDGRDDRDDRDDREGRDGRDVDHKNPKTKIAIIGSGPAGLSAAFYLLRMGYPVTIFDRHPEPGGLLRYHITEDKLPRKELDEEINVIRRMGAEFRMNSLITREIFETRLLRDYAAIIIATGREEKQITEDFGLETDEHGIHVSRKTFEVLEDRDGGDGRDGRDENRKNPNSPTTNHQPPTTVHQPPATSHPPVFACGNVISRKQMAVRSVAQGKGAAFSADHFLRTGKPGRIHRMFNSSFGRLDEREFEEYLKESPPSKRKEPAKGFMGGFSEEEARKEAFRCMNCDCRKTDTCKLRIYATEYEARQKHYFPAERNLVEKHVQHEFVIYEPEKCIRCGICIEVTKAEKELHGLAYIGRGFDVRIGGPLGSDMRKALGKCGEKVVEACPTGALAVKTGKNV